MGDTWPHEPLYIRAQPRPSARRRHPSEATIPHMAAGSQSLRVDENGQLMMPVVDEYGRLQRASSVSGNRPAQIIINNDNTNRYEENERPVSAHAYFDYEGEAMEKRPSHRTRKSSSVVRRRTPEVYEDERYYYDVEGRRRRVMYHDEEGYYETSPRLSPRPKSPHRRSKEDEDKIKELEEKEKELRELREKEKEKQRLKDLQEKLLLEQLEKEKKRLAREAEDKKLREKAIEDFKEKQKEEEAKRRQEKEEEEAKFIELLRTEGYTEAEAKKKLKRMERRKEKGITKDDEDEGENDRRIMKPQPTYIKVQTKHISPETADDFALPWEYDERDPSYIIIKRWVGEREQELLFNHTKAAAQRARLAYPKHALKEDATRLVLAGKSASKERKKSPHAIKRTSWFLT